MTTEDPTEELLGEPLPDEHSLDELARGLATGALSRRPALRLASAALLGGALGVFGLTDLAEAKRRRKRRRTACIPCGTAAGLSPTCPASGQCCNIISNGIGCCLPCQSPPPPGPPCSPPCPTAQSCLNGTCCPDALVCGSGASETCCPQGTACVNNACCQLQEVCGAGATAGCCPTDQCCGSGTTAECCTDPNCTCGLLFGGDLACITDPTPICFPCTQATQSQCPSGVCDTNLGNRCRCFDNSDCPGNTVCLGGIGQCGPRCGQSCPPLT